MFLTPADYLPGPLFRRKLSHTVETLLKTVPPEQPVGVAFSGGKDSCVLLHLLRRLFGPHRVFAGFYDSGLELPQTYEFISPWNVTVYPIRPDYFPEPMATTLRQLHEKNWIEARQILHQKTPLQARREWEQERERERERLSLVDLLEYGGYWGCPTPVDTQVAFPFEEILVKYPSRIFRQQYAFQYLAIGVRAEESLARTHMLSNCGMVRYSENDELCYLYPLAHWTCEDVCHYLALHRVPYHPSYDLAVAAKRPRCAHRVSPLLGLCGCEYGRLAYTFMLYPDLMRYLSTKFPAILHFKT